MDPAEARSARIRRALLAAHAVIAHPDDVRVRWDEYIEDPDRARRARWIEQEFKDAVRALQSEDYS